VSILYHINANSTNISAGYSLVDRGANGGLLGNDVRILHQTNRSVTITGIDNHQIGDLPIGTGAAYGLTHKGPVIFIMHQYACLGHGTTIHSSGQLEAFKIIVDEKSWLIGGTQRISTPDGFFIPLDIVNGLPYFKIRAPTDLELESLPNVILTSDKDWNPTVLDNVKDIDASNWYPKLDQQTHYGNHQFDVLESTKYDYLVVI
jgi:hypothetical protein